MRIQPADRVGIHGLHDIADEGAVLRAAGFESRLFVAAPDDDVGGVFDFLDLVAIDDLLVAGEIEHLRAGGAEGLPDREQHRVAQAPAAQDDGFARLDFGRRAGRSHEDHRLALLQHGAQVGGSAHLEDDGRHEPSLAIHPRAGEGEALHLHARSRCDRRERLEILQPVELAGPEFFRCERRVDHDFDDVRREARDALDFRNQPVGERSEELADTRRLLGRSRGEHPRHRRIALLGRAHRLYDVAEE